MSGIVNSNKESKQFLTFGLIGVINTLISQGVYMLIILIYPHLLGGGVSVVGDGIAMVVSYFLNMKFTYHEKPALKSAVAFPIGYLPGIIISSLMITLSISMGVPKFFAKLITLPITIPLNFICVSLIVKKTNKVKEENN